MELEKEVSDLTKDLSTVKNDIGTVKGDVKEILHILSGNPKVTGDKGVTGRILLAETRLDEIEDWKLKKADYVIDQYDTLKENQKVFQAYIDKNSVFGSWTKWLLSAIGGAAIVKIISWLFSNN